MDSVPKDCTTKQSLTGGYRIEILANDQSGKLMSVPVRFHSIAQRFDAVARNGLQLAAAGIREPK